MTNDKARIAELEKKIAILESQVRRLKFGVSSTPEALQKAASGICTFCDKSLDDEPRPIRGMHQRCYRKLSREMPARGIDWDDAVEAGLCLAESASGRKPIPSKLDEIAPLPSKPFDAEKAHETLSKYTKKPRKKGQR